MKAPAPTLCLLAVALLGPALAHSQGNSSSSGPSMQLQNPCLADVSKFEQAIGLVRQTSGNAAAAGLKEKLLPAKLENEILMRDGYCGLSRYLRGKHLL